MTLPEEKKYSPPPKVQAWRQKMYEIIFESNTPAGKAFDVALLWAIIISVLAVILESVRSYETRYGHILKVIEWFFTILFTIEYVARVIAVRRPRSYIFSLLGMIDFLAIVPTYLSLFLTGGQFLLAIRIIRLLRVFRIFKLSRFLGGAETIIAALTASIHKITVFLGAVLALVTIMGTLMYLIEGPGNGFTSIPKSIYWAIVTLTTVGYGDMVPATAFGKAIASLVMIAGYSIIAVPTGIVTVELGAAGLRLKDKRVCPVCNSRGHDEDAVFCKKCGNELP